MKQRRLKSIAAFLLILTLITPYLGIQIDAAAKFTLKSGKAVSSILYANSAYTLKVGNQKVYYYSSNKSLISVNKTSGKLTVKEPGKCTITAKSRTTNRTICKKTFTIRRRSDYIYSTTKNLTMVTGDTKKVSVKKSPSNSTDVIRFKSNNTKVATVSATTGKITAVGPGTTNIVAYSKASASTSYSSSSNRTFKFKVKVYSGMSSAKQIEKNQVEITFAATPATLTPTDFTITSKSGRKVTASYVTVTGKKAVLILNQNLTDGDVYTIKYRSSSCKFTASDGIIKKFVISPTQIPINTETLITAQAYDANGILIDEYIYGNTYSNITFTVSSTYLTSDKKINFPTAKSTATARIKSTKTVNGLTTTIADSGNVTITSYDPELVSAQFRCHITNSATYTFTDTSVCKSIVPNESTDYNAFINIINSYQKEISDYSKYHVESSNTSVLIVTDGNLSNSKKYASLLPVKQGTAYLYVKDTDNTTVHTFSVTVSAPATLTTLRASTSSINLVNTQTTAQDVTITATDQYGNSMDQIVSGCLAIECTATTAVGVSADYVNAFSSSFYKLSYPTLTFYGTNLWPGRYTYKLQYENKYTYIYVVISGITVSAAPSVSPSPSVSPTPSPSPSATVTVTPVASIVPTPSTTPTVSNTPATSATPTTSVVPEVSTSPVASTVPSETT